MTIELFTSIMGGLATAGVMVLAVGWMVAKFKEGGMKAVEERETKLRKVEQELREAQDRKIEVLIAANTENQKQIALLTGRVEELSRTNTDLTTIINQALDRFFREHPEEAFKLTAINSIRRTDA